MKLGRFAIYNLVGAVVPVIVTIATAPLYIHAVGLERYGIITITWIMVGYTAAFDAGLSRAAARSLAKLSLDMRDERAAVVFTVFWTTLALGSVGGGALFLGLSYFIPALPVSSPEIVSEYSQVLPLVCIAFPFLISVGVAGGALESRGQFLLENIISCGANILGQVLPLVAALTWGPHLQIVIAMAVFVQLLRAILMTLFALRAERITRLCGINRSHLPELFAFGGWVTVTNLVSPIMSVLDTTFLGWKLGSAALTYYSVPMSIVSRVSIVPVAAVRAIFPTLSAKPHADALDLALHSLWILIPVLAIISGAGILGSHVAISLWMGSSFAEKAAPVAATLFVGIYANGVAYVAYTILQARGAPKIIALAHLLELPLYLLLLIASVELGGLSGAATAWTVRVICDSIILQWRAGLLAFSWKLHAFVGSSLLICLAITALVPMGLFASTVAICIAATTILLLVLVLFRQVSGAWKTVLLQVLGRNSAVTTGAQG